MSAWHSIGARIGRFFGAPVHQQMWTWFLRNPLDDCGHERDEPATAEDGQPALLEMKPARANSRQTTSPALQAGSTDPR